MRSYIKLDASFFRHPKAVAAGRDGRDLFIAGLCYAGDLLTDGFIPAGTLPMLAADSGVRNVKAAAEALVAAGLWEPEAGGYRAHDYRDYNSGSEEVRAKRDAARDRMQRLRSQDVRANNKRSSQDVREQEQYVQQEGSIEPNGSQEPLTIPSDDGTPPPKLDDNEPPQPYDLLEALCDAISSDPSVLSKRDKNLQLAVAKRLIEDGLTVRELRDVVAWLQRQTWVTSGIDFFLVEKQIGKWRMNGRQAVPPGPVAVPSLPVGVTWDLVREWRMRREQGRFLPDEHSRLLDQLDGKDQAA